MGYPHLAGGARPLDAEPQGLAVPVVGRHVCVPDTEACVPHTVDGWLRPQARPAGPFGRASDRQVDRCRRDLVRGGAMLIFLGSTRVSEENGFLGRTSRRAVGIAALVEGLVNLYVFPLAIELLLVPLLAMLGGMVALVAYKDEFKMLRKPLNAVVSCIGIGILVCVLGRVISDWSSAHLAEDLRSLALPIWLTIGLLPFIYVLGLVIAYESSFVRIDLSHMGDALARRRAKLALVVGVNFRAPARRVQCAVADATSS